MFWVYDPSGTGAEYCLQVAGKVHLTPDFENVESDVFDFGMDGLWLGTLLLVQ